MGTVSHTQCAMQDTAGENPAGTLLPPGPRPGDHCRLGSPGPALRATDLQEVKTLPECPLSVQH